MTILPLTYLGNLEYYSALFKGECVVDLYENYVKQTYRNRCEILTAGGKASLTVNVVGGRSIHKVAVRDTRIDNSKRWRHQHRASLVSSYRNSPYFEHYADKILGVYDRNYDYLADLNLDLLRAVGEILKMPFPELTQSYITSLPGDNDLRGYFKPSVRPILYEGSKYYQVFSDRSGFTPNLSVIDLIFCEGPRSGDFLFK